MPKREASDRGPLACAKTWYGKLLCRFARELGFRRNIDRTHAMSTGTSVQQERCLRGSSSRGRADVDGMTLQRGCDNQMPGIGWQPR